MIIDVISPSSEGYGPQTQLVVDLCQLLGIDVSPHSLLNVSITVMAVLIVSSSIFTTIRGYLFSLCGERVVQRIRNKLFAKLMGFEISFYDITRTGELINRLAADTTLLKDAVTVNVSMALRWTATVILGIGYLFYVSWKLTLVMLSVVPLVMFGTRIYGTKIRVLASATQEALAKATDTAGESLSQIRTVRSFAREDAQMELYADKINTTFLLGRQIALYYGFFIGGIAFVASCAMGLVLWYGAGLVLDGELSTGILMSYVLYTLTVAGALGGLSGLFGSFMQVILPRKMDI